MKIDGWQNDHDERRAAPRTSAAVDARLEHSGGAFSGRVVDISFGGAKFVTETTAPVLEIGTAVVLIVTHHADASAEPLTWEGTVVRSERSGDDGPDRIAYAIEFVEFAPRSIPGLDALG